MKRIALAAAALTMIAAPAFAQQASTVTLQSSVPNLCGVGNHISGGAINAKTEQFGVNLNNAGNGQFNGETHNGFFGNAWCNYGARVSISAAPLVSETTTTDTGSFTSRFDLDVSANGVYVGQGDAVRTWNTLGKPITGGELAAGDNASAFETGTGRLSAVTITVRKDPQNRRPVAGTYKGGVTLTLAAS